MQKVGKFSSRHRHLTYPSRHCAANRAATRACPLRASSSLPSRKDGRKDTGHHSHNPLCARMHKVCKHQPNGTENRPWGTQASQAQPPLQRYPWSWVVKERSFARLQRVIVAALLALLAGWETATTRLAKDPIQLPAWWLAVEVMPGSTSRLKARAQAPGEETEAIASEFGMMQVSPNWKPSLLVADVREGKVSKTHHFDWACHQAAHWEESGPSAVP